MLPSPSFHCDAVIANIQPTRVASEIGFRSVGSNPPTPPTVVRGRFGGSANSLEGPARMLAEGTLRKTKELFASLLKGDVQGVAASGEKVCWRSWP